ncbi:MAG: trk/ktr system potassium uptake protein [Clostridia bacterium]|nr:trk/ktr system potassium uptake protein [Clostridia bacterium]
MLLRFPRLTATQIVVLGFALVILLGAILLTLPAASADHTRTDFLTALFTATSAVCVTGLVVVDTSTHYSLFGETVILLLIQIGGLGWMTVATLVALLVHKRITLRERILIQEALNREDLSGVVQLSKKILLTTLVIEGLGALILAARFSQDLGLRRGAYYGLFHAVSAFNNAGFDLFGIIYGKFSSLTHYVDDPVVNFTFTSLIILGGLGFPVILELIQVKKFSGFSLHTKLVLTTTAFLIAAGTLLILALEWNNPKTLQPLDLPAKIMAAYFQAVTPRTCGFNTLDIAGMTTPSQFLHIALMFIGASPAGTGGGVKTTTFAVLLLAIWATVRGQEEVGFWGRRISVLRVYKALAVAFLGFAVVSGVNMVLLVTEKDDFLKTLYEVTSAFGTVGLTMGLTPNLTAAGRWLIIFTMFAGRVGPLSLAMALWKRQNKAGLRYPEEQVMLG